MRLLLVSNPAAQSGRNAARIGRARLGLAKRGIEADFLATLPDGGGTWQISRGGGLIPEWSARGELVFRRPDKDATWMCSARITASSRQLEVATPVDLFKLPSDLLIWGPHPDGKRFIAVRPLPPAFAGDRVEAILNWGREVEGRVPRW